MKAIILNSGRGSRLGTYTENIAKCMVDIGDGETIISRQLCMLQKYGVDEVIITTGYLRDTLIEYVDSLHMAIPIIYCDNEQYMTTNYIQSLCNIKDFDEECLLMHGDLVFSEDILQEVLQFDGSCMIADSTLQLPSKDFKGRVKNGCIYYVGIDTFDEDAVAVQPLYKLCGSDWNKWKAKIEEFCKNGNTNVYAENALNEIMPYMKIHMLEARGGLCNEIDNQEDLFVVREKKNLVYKPYCETLMRYFDCKDFKERLKKITGCHLVLILSKSAEKRWNMEECVAALAAQNVVVRIDDSLENPTQTDIANAMEVTRKIGEVDTVIAIGGGSSIDLAKAISAFSGYPTVLREEELIEQIAQKMYVTRPSAINLIAVPTTAGTGSELTSWATIWNKTDQHKYSIDMPSLQPREAWIVSELTTTLSPTLALSTGLDALCHAIEAYWSVHTNEQVQDIAYRSIRLTLSNLKGAITLEADKKSTYCDRMCRASVLAALAFSKTRTTACHSISYPLTMKYGMPHGYAVAATLVGVMQLNHGCYPQEDRLYKLFEEYGGLSKWLQDVCFGVVDLRLSAWGANEMDIDDIVARAFTQGRMDNNPYPIADKDVKEVLMNIL